MKTQTFRVFLEAQRNVANASEMIRSHHQLDLAAAQLEQAAVKLRAVQREYDDEAAFEKDYEN